MCEILTIMSGRFAPSPLLASLCAVINASCRALPPEAGAAVVTTGAAVVTTGGASVVELHPLPWDASNCSYNDLAIWRQPLYPISLRIFFNSRILMPSHPMARQHSANTITVINFMAKTVVGEQWVKDYLNQRPMRLWRCWRLGWWYICAFRAASNNKPVLQRGIIIGQYDKAFDDTLQ